MTIAPHSLVSLPANDRRALNNWLRSTSLRQGLSTRARILLDLHDGDPPTVVADAHRVSRKTVYKWVNRYREFGLDGLEDQPRSGRPSVIDKKTVERVLKLTTERVPHESTHWSIMLMAKYAGVTPWQVRQIWAAADLKPHRLKTFKISNDPLFAEKVTDIVALYMNPPSNALVLSVDEKTQIQALDRTQPGLPLSPGHVGSRTHDYKRNGTASLYAAFNILTGEVTGSVRPSQNAQEFLKFLNTIKRKAADGQDIHIILDNLSAHKTPAIKAWMEKNPHIHFHFTPTSASWLNAVEGWFAQLERRSLYRGVFTSVAELKDEINRFIKVHNAELAKPFQWTKDAKTIIGAVERAKKALHRPAPGRYEPDAPARERPLSSSDFGLRLAQARHRPRRPDTAQCFPALCARAATAQRVGSWSAGRSAMPWSTAAANARHRVGKKCPCNPGHSTALFAFQPALHLQSRNTQKLSKVSGYQAEVK